MHGATSPADTLTPQQVGHLRHVENLSLQPANDWSLMKGIGTFGSRSDAEAAERAVAEALERRGHRVFWG